MIKKFLTSVFRRGEAANPECNVSAIGINFTFDAFSKFHRSIFLKGWCSKEDGSKPVITNVVAIGSNILGVSWSYVAELPHLGSFAGGIEMQLLLSADFFPDDIELVFEIEGCGLKRFRWSEIQERFGKYNSNLASRFHEHLRKTNAKNLLDIGGRARSGTLRSKEFPGMKVDVLDILPDEGVTVVCDAHRMSDVLPSNHFDAIVSVSVFEHLVMPWKVALEMNKVMKKGAVAFILTHQTIGMHDLPWDFFRFSDSAWKGIFNRHTGFEILETEMCETNFIIPFFWSPRVRDAEKSAGFEFSAVMVRKVSDTQLDWALSASDVTEDMYPEGREDRSENFIKT